MATNGRSFLDKVNLEAGFGQIEGGLNATDPSTNDHHVSKVVFSETLDAIYDLLFVQLYHLKGLYVPVLSELTIVGCYPITPVAHRHLIC
jgi:hypothetical protein